MLEGRKFADVVARRVPGRHPQSQGQRHGAEAPAAGRGYDIPLRALLPQGIEGLLVAGRCLSGTHEAHSSYRVMPIVMATGQAAGVCAALAARRDLTPRAVPVADVQAALITQGADLGHPLTPDEFRRASNKWAGAGSAG